MGTLNPNRIYKLDLLKGAACAGVVFTHVTFPGLWGKAVMRAAGFAVPVFFMTAGYFAFGKSRDVMLKRLCKILKILLVGYLLYLCYNAWTALRADMLGDWISSNFDILTPVRYLIFCNVDFAVHLWYLIAMAETYVLWLVLLSFGWQRKQRALPLLFLLQFLLVIYCDSLDLDFMWQTNFLLRALPWFLLGYELRKITAGDGKESILRYLYEAEPLILYAIVLAGGLMAVLPSVLDLPIKLNAIGYVPYSTALFLLAVRKPDKSLCRIAEYIGSRLSMYIYVLHILMAGVARQLMIMLFGAEVQLGAMYQWTWPILTLAISIAVSMVVDAMVGSIRKALGR